MSSRETFRIPLRIVVYREGDDWIARGLEFDLIGDGPTQEEAVTRLGEAIVRQLRAILEYNNPANFFSPADGTYWMMFAAGADVANGRLESALAERLRSESSLIEDVEVREYETEIHRLRAELTAARAEFQRQERMLHLAAEQRRESHPRYCELWEPQHARDEILRQWRRQSDPSGQPTLLARGADAGCLRVSEP